jgi:hypothetical protein
MSPDVRSSLLVLNYSQPCAGGVHMAVLPPLTRAEIAAFKRDGFLIKRRA